VHPLRLFWRPPRERYFLRRRGGTRAAPRLARAQARLGANRPDWRLALFPPDGRRPVACSRSNSGRGRACDSRALCAATTALRGRAAADLPHGAADRGPPPLLAWRGGVAVGRAGAVLAHRRRPRRGLGDALAPHEGAGADQLLPRAATCSAPPRTRSRADTASGPTGPPTRARSACRTARSQAPSSRRPTRRAQSTPPRTQNCATRATPRSRCGTGTPAAAARRS